MQISGGGGGIVAKSTVAGIDSGLSILGAAISGAIEFALDYAEVAKVNNALDEAQKCLDEARAGLQLKIPSSRVGGSPVGKQLSHHSSLADEAVVQTLLALEARVADFRAKIDEFTAAMDESDQGAATTSSRGTTKVQGGA